MRNPKPVVAFAVLFALTSLANGAKGASPPKPTVQRTQEQRLDPGDPDRRAHFLPPVVRRLIARVLEELTPPKP